MISIILKIKTLTCKWPNIVTTTFPVNQNVVNLHSMSPTIFNPSE